MSFLHINAFVCVLSESGGRAGGVVATPWTDSPSVRAARFPRSATPRDAL